MAVSSTAGGAAQGRSHRVAWLGTILVWVALGAPAALAEQREELDGKVRQTLDVFARESPAGQALLEQAAGALVFPNVYKAGFGIGGEYGEGALLIDGKIHSYYSTSGASFGLQLGAQSKSQVILFMTRPALLKLRRSRRWEAGVDGRIAVVEKTDDGSIDARTASQPVIGFVFSNKGLMYNLTLEGNTITPLES